jgi:predicted Zn finger-like uncharacterized protein
LANAEGTMRFVCDSCRAQYMISDEKVGPNGVKVRCKKCGYVILVRKAEAPAAASNPLPPNMEEDDEGKTQVFENPMALLAAATGPNMKSPKDLGRAAPTAVLKGVDDDEISGVFDQVLTGKKAAKAEPPVPDESDSLGSGADDRLSTRILDAGMMQKLAEESSDSNGEATVPAGKKVNGNGTSHDWFVAIDEKQTGPLSVDKLKELWSRGEIGPDSLCWRAGFSDWLPLSEVAELSPVLAPKPSRPVIVAPGVAAPVVTVPVESAFSAGGMTKTVRSEVPVAFAGPSMDDTGSWKPSAASALASLVQEEISVLSKPKPTTTSEVPAAGAGFGLLDVPAPEQHARVNGNHAAVLPQGVNGAGDFSPYATARPPPAPAPSSKKGLVFGILGGILVLGLLATIAFLLLRTPLGGQLAQNIPVIPEKSDSKGSKETAKAAPTDSVPMPPPPPGTIQKPIDPVATATPAAPKSDSLKAPVVRSAPSPTSPSAPKPTRPVVDDNGDVGTFTAGKKPSKPVAEATGGDDEFDAVFGGSSSSKPKAAPTAKKSVTTYIPPAPGSADIPDSLGTSDVMAVVLANKPAIAKCVSEQKKKDPDVSGKLVMKWTITTSGKTSNVSAVSDEFRSSYVAGCIGGLIKSWQFPRHKTQGDPINFPFTF